MSTTPTPEEIALDFQHRRQIITGTRKVYIGISVVYLTFIITTAAWFVVRARKDASLAKRSVLLTLLGFTGNLLISTPFLLLQATSFPCFLILWGLYLGVTFTIFSLSARSWRLKFLLRVNKGKLERSRKQSGEAVRRNSVKPKEEVGSEEESEEDGDEVGPWPTSRRMEESLGTVNVTSPSRYGSTMGGSTLLTNTGQANISGNLRNPNTSGPLVGPRTLMNVSGRTIVGRAGSMWNTVTGRVAGQRGVAMSHGGNLNTTGELRNSGREVRPAGVTRTDSERSRESSEVPAGSGQMGTTGVTDDALASAAEQGQLGIVNQRAPSALSNEISFITTPEQSQQPPSKRGSSTPIPALETEPTHHLLRYLLLTTLLTIGYIATVTALSSHGFALTPITYSEQCSMGTWEMWPVLAIMAGFFILGCPGLVWWLRGESDAYGIRRDLVAFAVAGTFVAVMYGLEQILLPSGQKYGESPLRLYFGASNWPVIGLAVGHTTSIFLPLLASYDIHPSRPLTALFQRLYRAPSRESNSDDGSNEKLEGKNQKRYSRNSEKKQRKKRRKTGDTSGVGITWSLFASVLEDSECFEALKDFSARDFTAENPLFYEEYRRLMERVRITQTPAPVGESRLLPGVSVAPTGESSTAARPSTGTRPSTATRPPLDRQLSTRISVTDRYPVFDFTTRETPSITTRIINIFTRPFRSSTSSRRTKGRTSTSLFNFFSRSQPMLTPPPMASSPGSLLIPPQLRTDYKTFYKTFISAGAPCQVNLPARIVEEIARQVGDDSKVLPLVSVFDEARNEVLGAMFEMFPRFVEEQREGVLKGLLRGKKGRKESSRAEDVV